MEGKKERKREWERGVKGRTKGEEEMGGGRGG